ncbi:MAG TPA: fused MFS/spermidine synthase [Candidatus Polarisedimenticolaceae bacterium]
MNPLVLALLLSGAAALVLEGVWARWLSFSLGAGAYATTAVLATFMAGLGLGALAGGRFAARRSAAASLRAFAGIELANAAWALASIAWLPGAFPESAVALARALGSDGLPPLARFALACAALSVPTFLMGMTLPLAVRAAVEGAGDRGRRAGILYAANTLGGAVGAGLGATLLVDRVGLSGAVGAAAALQAITGLVAAALSRRAPSNAPGPEPDARAARPGLAAAAFAASGFAGLALEVGAQRILSLQLGSTVHAFATILAALLAGIGIGGALGAGATRRTSPEAALAVALAALGVGAGWAILALDLGTSGAGFVLLPAGIALGAVAGIVGRMAGSSPGTIPRRFAGAYAANAAASAAGALVAGLVLVPAFGATGTLRIAGAIAFSACALVLVVAVPARTLRLVCATLAVVAIALAADREPVRRTYERWFGASRLVALREGPVQAVAVTAESNDQHLDYRRLVAHRTSLAATHLASQRYMRLLGHLPTMLAEGPRRALVICLGTGTTLAAVTRHPELERIDVAEISPEVVDLVGAVHPDGEAALADPRVRVHVEDGRHVLLSASDPWDVITLEPPPPGDAGVVSLYTEEFYALCRRRLSPGGVTAQWIPLQSASLDDVRMLVGAFARSFPHAVAFLPLERDLVLLGSERPLARSAARWRDAFAAPGPAASMREVGFDSPETLLANAIADREALLRFSQSAPALTDDRPRVERRTAERLSALPDVRELRLAPSPAPGLVPDGDAHSAARILEARRALDVLREAEDARERGGTRAASALREAAWRARPSDAYFLWAARLSDAHLTRFVADASRRGDDPRAWASVGEKLLLRGDSAAARAAFSRALRTLPARDPAAVSIRAWLASTGPGPV